MRSAMASSAEETSKDDPVKPSTSAEAMTTTAASGDISNKRRKRIKCVPNLVKRRTKPTSAELPAGVKETSSQDTSAAENIQKQLNTSPSDNDEGINYMSEGGEGHFTTGDSNAFVNLSTSEASSEEDNNEEQRMLVQIGAIEKQIQSLESQREPLILAVKAKQEARRAKEQKELEEKKSLQGQQNVAQQQHQQKEQLQKQQPQQQPKQQRQQQLQQQQTQTLRQPQQKQHEQNEKQQNQQQQQNQKQQNQQQQPQPPTMKKEKVPPINTYKMELQDTINLCKSAIGQNFTIKRLNNDRHAIHCFTLEQHKKIKALLKESTTEFFSFTPKSEKLQTVLLKGIDSCTEPQVLLSELRQKANDDLDFIGVKPFATVRARREKRNLPFFLVQLSPSSKLDSLRSISVLNYQVVTWDKLKRRGDMLQCMRCQRFGHAAANCEMQSRCVKCGENHNVDECKLGKERVEDRTQLKCALCRGDGHPANYRGCPTFQLMKNNKAAKQTVVEKRPTMRPPTITPVNPQISYAQMASGRGSTAQPTPKVAQQASVPKAPAAQADIMGILLVIQGQLTGLQNQIREQATRVDYLYSVLPSLTQLRG